MKTKLKLNELKINSFVTALPNGHKVTVEGGTSAVVAVPLAPVASAALSVAASVVGAAAGLAWLITTVLHNEPPPAPPKPAENQTGHMFGCDQMAELLKKVEELIKKEGPSTPNCSQLLMVCP